MLRFLPKLVVGLKGKSAKSDPLLNLLTASLGTHFKESNSLLTSKEIKIENVDLPKATLDQINAILPDGTQINEVKISDVTVKVTSLKQALGNALSNMPFRIVIGNVRVTLALTPDVSAPSPAAADGATPAANGATAAAAADTASSAGGLFANEKIAQALRGVFKGLRIEVRRVMLRVIVRTRGTSTDGRRAQNHSYCLSIALRRLAFVSTDAGGKEVTSKDAEIFEDSARARADAAKAKKRRASGFGRAANECGGGSAPMARAALNTGRSTFYRSLTMGDIEVRLDPVTGASTTPIYFVRNMKSAAKQQPRLRCTICATYAELESWPTKVSVDVNASLDVELNVDDVARMLLLNRQMNIATNARAMRRAADSAEHEAAMAILDIAAGPAQALPGAAAAATAPRSGNGSVAAFDAFNMELEAALNLDRCTLTLLHDYVADADDRDDPTADASAGSNRAMKIKSSSRNKTNRQHEVGSDAGADEAAAVDGCSADAGGGAQQHVVAVSLDSLRLDAQIEHVTGHGWSDDWRVSLSLKEALCTQRDVGGGVGQAAAGVLFALAAPPMPSGAPPQSDCAFEVRVLIVVCPCGQHSLFCCLSSHSLSSPFFSGVRPQPPRRALAAGRRSTAHAGARASARPHGARHAPPLAPRAVAGGGARVRYGAAAQLGPDAPPQGRSRVGRYAGHVGYLDRRKRPLRPDTDQPPAPERRRGGAHAEAGCCGRGGRWTRRRGGGGAAHADAQGPFILYRYISCESYSQFDSLPLTYFLSSSMLKLAAVQLTNRWVAREQIRTVRGGRGSPPALDHPHPRSHHRSVGGGAGSVPFGVLASTDAEAAEASVGAEIAVVPDGTAAAEKRAAQARDLLFREAGAASPARQRARSRSRSEGECSFMYRYISRESCSQFDSLPLTSLTMARARDPKRARRSTPPPSRGCGERARRIRQRRARRTTPATTRTSTRRSSSSAWLRAPLSSRRRTAQSTPSRCELNLFCLFPTVSASSLYFLFVSFFCFCFCFLRLFVCRTRASTRRAQARGCATRLSTLRGCAPPPRARARRSTRPARSRAPRTAGRRSCCSSSAA